MTNISKLLVFAAAAAAFVLTGCSDSKSYAELLQDENKAINSFLAENRVIGYEERDSTFKFEVGKTAPYYQLDEEGNVYMQVLNAGTEGYRPTTDQLIYFRFTRYNMYSITDGELPEGQGNDEDVSVGSASFRYNNFTSQQSYQWGTGLQMPLNYLPIDCEVNVVIKSQYGMYAEIANVVPYLYNVRYFKSQI